MQNENHCRHLRLKENLSVYRRGGKLGPMASQGVQRYQFLCKLGGKKSRRHCRFMFNRADECPDYEE